MDIQNITKFQYFLLIKKRAPLPTPLEHLPFGMCNAPATFQRCMLSIFSDMVGQFLEIFMDDFSVFGSSFDDCLQNLTRVLKRCIETNLVLSWEKSHFMVREGIMLGHIVSE